MATDKIRTKEERLKQYALELYRWQHHGATNFTAMLFDLIAKADQFNRTRLRMGFPDQVEAFELWQAAPTEQQYYRDMGIHEVRA